VRRDPSRPLYGVGYGRAGRCTFVIDEATLEACEKPSVYRVRLRRWAPTEPDAGCCAEHGAIARAYPDLESMRSYQSAATP
jgi:hypothetical protein